MAMTGGTSLSDAWGDAFGSQQQSAPPMHSSDMVQPMPRAQPMMDAPPMHRPMAPRQATLPAEQQNMQLRALVANLHARLEDATAKANEVPAECKRLNTYEIVLMISAAVFLIGGIVALVMYNRSRTKMPQSIL